MINGTFRYRGVTLGADPELFLKDKKTKQFFPACGLIGGTKERPKKIDRKGHAIQEDNVMVEFNIPPAVNLQQWQFSIAKVLAHLEQKLPQFELCVVASAEFDPAYLQSKQARTAGCDPDYDAWAVRINNPPQVGATNIRTGAGHIHIGYKDPELDNQLALVKAMDLFVGIPSVVLDPDRIRKSLYGKAGAFRPKPYGVEWRVASNFWVRTPQLQAWAYHNTHKAVAWLNAGETITQKLGETIQKIINSGDTKSAKSLSVEYGLLEGA